MAEENLDDVLDLVNEIRLSYPQKSIWIYTGYKVIGISDGFWRLGSDVATDKILYHDKLVKDINNSKKRSDIISKCDVLIDGKYINLQRDITLSYRGSKNQRLIDVQETIQENKIVLFRELNNIGGSSDDKK